MLNCSYQEICRNTQPMAHIVFHLPSGGYSVKQLHFFPSTAVSHSLEGTTGHSMHIIHASGDALSSETGNGVPSTPQMAPPVPQEGEQHTEAMEMASGPVARYLRQEL